MSALTEAGQNLVSETAARHGLSEGSVVDMLTALASGGGTQAQFNIQELGGMGQWAQGGMTMVGDMFNDSLKARVNALCQDLAQALQSDALFAPPAAQQSQVQGHSQRQVQGAGVGSSFFRPDPNRPAWPADLGTPASEGAQNDLRYAYFPNARRLAIAVGGKVVIYDTGDHQIGGFGQAQGAGQSLTFTSQHGLVAVDALPVVDGHGSSAPPPVPASAPAAAPAPAEAAPQAAATDTVSPPQSPAPAAAPVADVPAATPTTGPIAARPASLSDDEIFSRLERLGDLRDRGILTEEEFAAKKAELLARL